MTSAVVNRATIRQQVASLLSTALVGSGKPAQVVYRFKKADFAGQSPVVVVTSGPVTHERATNTGRATSAVDVEIHTFVRYMSDPQTATNSPTAGSSKTITIPNTSGFVATGYAAIDDGAKYEIATVSAVNTNVSIVVATLANSYTTPKVYWLNEELSEDTMDLLEKGITDALLDNVYLEGYWTELAFSEPSVLDPVAIGGKEYNHEVITVKLQVFSE